MTESNSKLTRFQIGIFILCFASYGFVHVQRIMWSLSKPKIEDDINKYHCTKEKLSDVDTVNQLVYGLA